MMLEYKESGGQVEPKVGILSRAMQGWFVPVDLIRSYYGDGIAVYYEFMNFFLRWMIVPAIMGTSIFVLNRLFLDDLSKSPFSAFFSIGMSVWAALFSINW